MPQAESRSFSVSSFLGGDIGKSTAPISLFYYDSWSAGPRSIPTSYTGHVSLKIMPNNCECVHAYMQISQL